MSRKPRGRLLTLDRRAQPLALTLPPDAVHGLQRVPPDPASRDVNAHEAQSVTLPVDETERDRAMPLAIVGRVPAPVEEGLA